VGSCSRYKSCTISLNEKRTVDGGARAYESRGDPIPTQTLQRNQTEKFSGQRLKMRVSFNNSHMHSISQNYRRAQRHLSSFKIDVTLELTQ